MALETAIIRLRPSEREQDVLGALFVAPPRTSEERSIRFRYLEREFNALAAPLLKGLSIRQQKTQAHLQDSWGRSIIRDSDAILDILTSPSAPQSSVLGFQPLVASHAIAVRATADVIADLVRDPWTEHVHENYVFELPDQDAVLSSGTGRTGGTTSWHLQHQQIHDAQKLATGQGVRVAILDTGLDITHAEFARPGASSIPFAEWDDLGALDPHATIRDTHWHGTHVAGILAGQSVGVAPGVDLCIGLAAPYGSATFAQLSEAMAWAGSLGVDIVSMSVGKDDKTGVLMYEVDLLAQNGILLIAAIGNSGHATDRSPGNLSSVIGVGAVDQHDQIWPQSSRNAAVTIAGATYPKPDLYAPGVDIDSCVPVGPPDYMPATGTSMATPIVAGVAALIKELHPSVTVPALRSHLLNRCDIVTVASGTIRRLSALNTVSSPP